MDQKKLMHQLLELQRQASQEGINLEEAIQNLPPVDISVAEKTSAWSRVQAARSPSRPKPQDYVHRLFPDFLEMHGDRICGDDAAIMGGVARLEGMPVTVIAVRRGNDLTTNMQYRFGMPLPEGYRKALRLMRQAEKFQRPVLLFVDTPGAYPGIASEDHGISVAIAENLYYMSNMKVPLLSVVTGEGGSGGALALMVADRIVMLQNAFLSVISPEGCASILFKDSAKAPEAAQSLGIEAQFLHGAGVVDKVIEEPAADADTLSAVVPSIRQYLLEEIAVLQSKSAADLLSERYAKIRAFGKLTEEVM